MAVRLDRSERSVVVWCSDCPSWCEVVLSDEQAHRAAVDHEQRVHPGQDQAWNAADAARKRRLLSA